MASDFGFEPSENKNAYFISYNTEDADRIRPIVYEMHKSGVKLWYDGGLDHGGNGWDEQIATHIHHCKAVIMFITKGIFIKKNSFVKKEFVLATQHYDKQIFVVMMDTIEKDEISDKYASWWYDLISMHLIYDVSAKGIMNAISAKLSDSEMSPGELCEKGVAYFKKNQFEQAVKYYKLAIKNDDQFSYTKAQFCLAMCYFKGKGVAKNDQEAYRLLKQAADNGNYIAMSYMGYFFLKGYAVNQNPKKAVECFETAAKYHIDWAQFNLGKCYEEGTGVDKDMKKAVKYYKLAASHKNAKAINALKRLNIE